MCIHLVEYCLKYCRGPREWGCLVGAGHSLRDRGEEEWDMELWEGNKEDLLQEWVITGL